MFRKRRKTNPAEPADAFNGLRQQILNLDPVTAGLGSEAGTPNPWGSVMDTGYPHGAATLVCLRDGTTSLYTSSGFGIIGGGAHESVVAANRGLFAVLESTAAAMAVSDDASAPRDGVSVLRALTVDGQRNYTAREEELGEGRHPFSELFHAAHGVITELRIVHEASARDTT